MGKNIYYDAICTPVLFVFPASAGIGDTMDVPVKNTDVIILDSMEIRKTDASNPS